MQTLRIVFMGTPDFAVPCLQTLLESPTAWWVCLPSRISHRGAKWC